MKIPARIKLKLIRIDRLTAESKKLDADLREWFEKSNMLNDSVIDPYIDTVEYQDGSIEAFIEMLESDEFEIGNNDFYIKKDGK